MKGGIAMNIKNVYEIVYNEMKEGTSLSKSELQGLSVAILSSEETTGNLLGRIARYAERIARRGREEWWQVRHAAISKFVLQLTETELKNRLVLDWGKPRIKIDLENPMVVCFSCLIPEAREKIFQVDRRWRDIKKVNSMLVGNPPISPPKVEAVKRFLGSFV